MHFITYTPSRVHKYTPADRLSLPKVKYNFLWNEWRKIPLLDIIPIACSWQFLYGLSWPTATRRLQNGWVNVLVCGDVAPGKIWRAVDDFICNRSDWQWFKSYPCVCAASPIPTCFDRPQLINKVLAAVEIVVSSALQNCSSLPDNEIGARPRQ